MPTQTRGTQWIATLNNPTEAELAYITQLQGRELVVDQEGEGAEEGSTKTPHLHIFLHLTKRAYLSTLKKLLPRAHWELAQNREQAVNYCSKGKVLIRRLTGQGKCNDLEDAIAVLRSEGLAAVQDQYPKQFVLHSRGLVSLKYSELDRRAKPVPQIEWYWGPTGSGKTRTAVGDAVNMDNIYIQRGPQNKGAVMWWDGYEGQDQVVLDDYRPWWCPFSFLLGILDRYPIHVQTKGGWVNFIPSKIIITTPLSIDETFTGEYRTAEDIQQVKRRVHRVVHFCTL